VNDRHAHEPDPAALDELSRAFGDRDPDPEPELVIIEQVPVEPEPVEPEPVEPVVIRIDDFDGSNAGDEESPGPDPGSHDDIVVISVEDDLPDPVYVEGSLDRDGSRSIVFIEDDETGDTVAVDAGRDTRRGIEPRMRERRVAVRRAQSRKRLKWVALVTAVVVVAVTALALLGSPLFAVRADQLTVTGNVYADPDRLDEIIDDLVGTPTLRVDTQRLEREIEAIPWVERARVTVRFPHAATIDVRERAAMTTYQGPDGRFRVLDRDGRVLDVIDKYPFAYLLISGPDPVDLEPGDFAPAGYAAASELAKNLTASVRGRVDHVDVTADGSRLVLHLDDGSAVFFGEARDFFAKLVRLESVLAANPDREPGPIDVSTDDVTL
jgi:cell division protein FtsQ